MALNDQHERGIAAEQFISELAAKTFLEHWCFSSPKDNSIYKKEICDLLILFKDHCIICQIKNIRFQGNHERYFRKAVEEATKQISGAEKTLYGLSETFRFASASGSNREFISTRYPKVTRIVVHMGEGYQYKHFGSFRNNCFVHNLGSDDFIHLISELRTIPDFVEYLNARERLLTDVDKLVAFGTERDLLALYLQIRPRFFDFVKDNKSARLILDMEESWTEFEKERTDNEEALLKAEELIRWYSVDLLKQDMGFDLVEELMSFSKWERRIFAMSMVNFIEKFHGKSLNRIIRRNIVIGSRGVVFFFHPEELKGDLLRGYMQLAGEGFSYYLDYAITTMLVVGIPEIGNTHFMLCDYEEAKGHRIDELKMLLDSLGWFDEATMTHWRYSIGNFSDL